MKMKNYNVLIIGSGPAGLAGSRLQPGLLPGARRQARGRRPRPEQGEQNLARLL